MNYSVVIVGSGTSGQTVAIKLAQAGISVALIDDRPLGGTCALRGCTAKKYFVVNRELMDGARDLQAQGLEGLPLPQWEQTLALKNRFTDTVPENTLAYLKSLGIHVFQGTAVLNSPDSLQVIPSQFRRASESAKTTAITELTFDSLVLACGSDPRVPQIPGIELTLDSEDFLSLAQAPQSMIILGAGYIAFEFSHIAASYGARVTILDRNASPLPLFDPGLVQQLLASAQSRGIRYVPESSAASIEKTPGGLRVTDTAGNAWEAEVVLNATGRVPRTAELNCPAGNVELKGSGIRVDAWGRSASNPKVFAVGDSVAGLPMLAPVADGMAEVVAEVLLNRGDNSCVTPFSSLVIPSTVFSNPPLASVGLSETAAGEKYGEDLIVNASDTSQWISSQRIGQRHSGYKVLIQRSTKKILGAHLLSHNSSEVINIFALAMAADLPAPQLEKLPWAYPTAVSDIKYMLRTV
ncbi:MAG: NAD(P)/FAD-dependent oxidoreductase [Spirochaetales bacterium]|nr:NAD(P)/FAD-dependent oxidoreductase [Spirochaetales bacterium]